MADEMDGDDFDADGRLLDEVARSAASRDIHHETSPVKEKEDVPNSPIDPMPLIIDVPQEMDTDDAVDDDNEEALVICEPECTTVGTQDGVAEENSTDQGLSVTSEEGRQRLKELSDELISLNEEGQKTFRSEVLSSEEGTPKRKQKDDRKRKKTTKKGGKAKKAKTKATEGDEPDELGMEPVTELDRILEDTAERNNLTVQNVKNILRRIITNEHVLAMLRNTMLADGEGVEVDGGEVPFEPKFTRAKARELMERQPHLLWPVSPVKASGVSTSQKLLQEEFAEESESDEEYHPASEESEDDSESMASTSFLSGLGSPSPWSVETPDATIDSENLESSPEKGLVICGSPTPSEKEGVIAERTRSKLPLNDTPLESIEAQFVAPDITTDMYDTTCDNEEWREFLMSFTKPLEAIQEPPEDNDAEDPEYNFLEEDEEDPEDPEDLRNDRAVKISKKELNELMTEVMQAATKELLDVEDDEEVAAIPKVSVASRTQTPSREGSSVPAEPTETEIFQEATELVQKECYGPLLPRQVEQLEEQMRMHVQLLTQMCILSTNNDALAPYLQTSESLLRELHRFARRSLPRKSYFEACNLEEAIRLIGSVPRWGGCTPLKVNRRIVRNNPIKTQVPSHVREILCESRVFLYPDLLPVSRLYTPHNDPFRKVVFLPSEDHLVALGLEQFVPPRGSPFLPVNLKLIRTFLLPVKTEQQIKVRIKNVIYKPQMENNPIKFWSIHRIAMPMEWKPYPIDVEAQEPPSKQPISSLPIWMQHYLLSRSAQRPAIILPVTTATTASCQVVPVAGTVIITTATPLATSPVTIQAMASPLPQLVVSPLRHVSPLKQISTLRHVSPLKQISPILRKYNHIARRILPNSPASVRKKLQYPREASSAEEGSGDAVDEVSPATRHIGSKGEEVPREEKPAEASDGDPSASAADDDEGDLAALMAASSTIRRAPHTRKQSKQQRETEATLALLAPDLIHSDPQKEDREMQFAMGYLQKVQETLQDDSETFQRFLRVIDDGNFLGSDRSAAQVFEEVSEVLGKYPELVDDFVSFLLPEQALECGKFTEYLLYSKIRLFLRKLEVHFSQQPQQLQRILKTLNQVQRQPDVTAETLCSTLQPLLRGQSHLLDEFLKLLPSQKVPESAMTNFEEVTVPEAGEEEDSCEEVTLSPVHETLGTRECPCPCHREGNDSRYVSRTRHCTKCGIKFLDGRVFVQTGKVLRPAQVTYGSLRPSPPRRGSLPRSPTGVSPLEIVSGEHIMSPISLAGETGKTQDNAQTEATASGERQEVVACPAEPSWGEVQEMRSWSRVEDCVLLQSCQHLGMDKGLQEAAETLHRTPEQVQARLQELLVLFEAHKGKEGSL